MSELGPEARDILRNGRDGDDPLPADRARIHSALMAAIAAGAVTTVAGQASAGSVSVGAAKPIATSLLGSVFAKGVLILFLGAGGIGAFLAWPQANSSHGPVERHVIDSPEVSPFESITPPPTVASKETLTALTEKPAEPAIPAAAASALLSKPLPFREVVSAPAPKPAEEPVDSLIAETQRLREAHGAMRGGDPEKALALLSEQAAEGEGQKLREERAAARVLALCKLGRVDDANAEAAAFLAQNPRSPLADRVRNACPKSR